MIQSRSFWAALLSVTIAGCGPEEAAQKDNPSPRERRSTVSSDNQREKKVIDFKERFRHFRNHASLVRGNILTHAEVRNNPYFVIDKSTFASLAYAPGRGDEADSANFIFAHEKGPGRIQGEVDYLGSHKNGYERIFVLKRTFVIRPGSKPEPYTLSDYEVARIADLFATMMGPDADKHQVPTFAVYDSEAGPWMPDKHR
jgi:hypothetical protein